MHDEALRLSGTGFAQRDRSFEANQCWIHLRPFGLKHTSRSFNG